MAVLLIAPLGTVTAWDRMSFQCFRSAGLPFVEQPRSTIIEGTGVVGAR